MSNDLVVINEYTGLPANLGDITTPEAVLMPLPIDEWMNVITEMMSKNNVEKDTVIFMGDFYDYLDRFDILLYQKYQFKDWYYELRMIPQSDGEIMVLEMVACKMNTSIVLSVESGVLESEFVDYGTADFFISNFYYFLEDCQKSIAEWNKICTYNVPMLEKEPDIDEFRNRILHYVKDFVEEEEANYRTDYNWDEELFRDEHYFHMYLLVYHLEYLSFKQDEYTFTLENVFCDEWGILKIYLKVGDTDLRFLLYDYEYDFNWRAVGVMGIGEEIESWMDGVKHDMMIWNLIMEGEL